MKPSSKLVSPMDMKKWPKLASIKYDGIRASTHEEGILSNSLKMIPNEYTQRMLSDLPPGLDGELVLRGEPGKLYDNNQSAFMSQHGQPDFEFRVFDSFINPSDKFQQRLLLALSIIEDHAFAKSVAHTLILSPEFAIALYDTVRDQGYEGLILRDPNAPYKFGRSTPNQEWGMKMKPFDPDEAKVVGFTELYHNQNDSYQNELGNSVRSTHQNNKVPGDKLGALIADYNGNEFKIGTGFSDAQRQELWDNREHYLGKLVRFKHQGITKSGVPRGPAVFLGWRNKLDMG